MTLGMKFEEYKREGIAIGEKQGIAIGEKKGIAIGEKRGKTEGKLETAKNLLKLNILSDEQIAQSTGLPLEQITSLRMSAKK